MKAVHIGVGLAAVVAGLGHSGAALACGASAPPYYVVEQQAPTGASAPINVPIVVTLRIDPNGPVGENFSPALSLTKAGSDVLVQLKPLGGLSTLTWVPVQPLEPDTTYEAHFNPGYEGIPDTIWPFTTATKAAPTLSLDGQLQVSLESAVESVATCPCTPGCGNQGDCAGACSNQLVNVTKARVVFPRALYGFAERAGAVWLTDDKPYEFFPFSKTGPKPYQGNNVSTVAYADLDDPDVTEVLITLPEGEAPYKPCFAFDATDARGDQATAQPLCLDELFPAGTASEDPTVVDPDDGHDGLAHDMKQPSRTSSGCSVGRAGYSGAWLVSLGLLGLMRRWRPTAAR